MAVNINTLITGSMSIGSSGHAETIFTFTNNRTVSLDISGELNPFDYDDAGNEVLDYDGSEKLSKLDLVSVDIGNTVTSIGFEAFFDCSSLTNVTIGNGVTSIGDSAFAYCYNLTSVTIGNSVTSIGKEAFSGCSGLTSVTIPDSVTSIENNVFFNCTGLTSVTFEGKSMAQVQAMDHYEYWGIENTSIINVA